MGRIKDLTNIKFGKLKVLRITEKRYKKHVIWFCKCDCGNDFEIKGSSLTSGHTKTCGKCTVNKYELCSNYYVGYTAKLEKFYFDKVDFELISKYSWHISLGYVSNSSSINKDKHTTKLHRLILCVSKDEVIDHIDGNPLNNRRNNLRICSSHQNSMNSKKPTKTKTSSLYKGVNWDIGRKKWRAYINYKRTQIFLGRYDSEIEAAKVYNEKAKEIYKEFANLNIIET